MTDTPDSERAAAPDPDSDPSERTVVVACDGSWQTTIVLERAAQEARQRKGRLVVLTIAVEGRPGQVFTRGDWDRLTRQAQETARYVVAETLRHAAQHFPDVPVSTVVAEDVKDGAIAKLGAVAELLVLGRRGKTGRQVFVLGSVSDALARRFSCPLLICHEDTGAEAEGGDHVRSVVVGISSKQDADVMLDIAAAEARARAWPLTIVQAQARHASDDDPVLARVWEWTRTGTPAPAEQPASTPALVVTKDEPVAALVNHVRPGDLLVVGTRGEGRLAGLIAGSVAHGVLERMPCDILIVRATTGTSPRQSR